MSYAAYFAYVDETGRAADYLLGRLLWEVINDYQHGVSTQGLDAIGTFAGFAFGDLSFAGKPQAESLLYGWTDIINEQYGTWNVISSDAGSGWVAVNTSESTTWEKIDTSQTGNWKTIKTQ